MTDVHHPSTFNLRWDLSNFLLWLASNHNLLDCFFSNN
jgi:hypothetical protein